jgi:NitT/TauT family transport system substrate-binding protein
MKLRLAENFRAVFYAPFYATQALGYFAREGVEVEFIASSTPGDAIAGLLDGTIDLTWGGPMRVMQALERDPASPLVCFAEVVARDPFYLVGSPDLGDVRLADLARLRIGTVAEVPTPWMCLQHDLRLAGLDPARLDRIADRTMAANLAALRTGSIDAAQVFEPFVTTAVEEGIGRILYAASARGPCVYTSFIASRARIAHDRPAFAAMTRAIAAMQRWLAANDGAALAAATAPYFPDVAPARLAGVLQRYHAAGIWAATPAMSREGFVRLAESFQSGGMLARMPRFEACVDASLSDG